MTDSPIRPDAGAPHALYAHRISWRVGGNFDMFSGYAYGYAIQPCRACKIITSRPDLPSRRNTCLKLQSSRASRLSSAWALAPSTRTRPRPFRSNPCPPPSMSSLFRAKANTANLTSLPRACGAIRAPWPRLARGALLRAQFTWRAHTPCATVDGSRSNVSIALPSFAASRRMSCRKPQPLSPLVRFLSLGHAPNTARPPSPSRHRSMSNRFRSRVSNPENLQARGQALFTRALSC